MITQFLTQIFENKLILTEILLFITITISSLYIFKKANFYYKLSGHKGLKYFAITFLYLAISGILNFTQTILEYIINKLNLIVTTKITILLQILEFTYDYTIIIAILLLTYSLVWKDLEKNKIKYKTIILQLIAIIIALINLRFKFILHSVTLILLIYGIIISYANHITNKTQNKKSSFSQLYFISLILIFIIYLSNFLIGFFPILKLYGKFIIILVFLIFLYGAINPQIKSNQNKKLIQN